MIIAFWILVFFAMLRLPGPAVWTVFSPFFALLGSYFALRSIFVARIENKLRSNYFSGVKWQNMPLHERFIFRVFSITKDDAYIFFTSEIDLTPAQKDLKKNLFSYKEPFLALFFYALAFVIEYLKLIYLV